MSNQQLPPFLKAHEAYAILPIEASKFYELVNDGTIPFVRLKGMKHRRYRREDILAYLNTIDTPIEGTA